MNPFRDFKSEIKLFLIVAAVSAVLAVAGILLLSFTNSPIETPQPQKESVANEENECKQIEQEIDDLIAQANYCEADSDCIVNEEAVRGPCGCWNLVNKEADLSGIKEKNKELREACNWPKIKCPQCPMPPQILSCQENKCMGVAYTPAPIHELKEKPALWDGWRVAVEGVYRWGFEDSNFDETADSEEYNIWVEVDPGATKLEQEPSNFDYAVELHTGELAYVGGEGSARVTMYGTFHAGDPERSRNYGHLSGWKHQIVADKIVFKEATWQTYRSDEFGFEVKYPEGWTLQERRGTSSCPFHLFEDSQADPRFQLSINCGSSEPGGGAVEVGDILVGGVRGTQYRVPNVYHSTDALVILVQNGDAYKIGGSLASTEREQTFNQILSTFRFVE